LVNDQLDPQFFPIYLFQFSTCFEQPFPTCTRNGHRHRVTYTTGCMDTIDSPDDEHGVARNM